MAHSEMTVIGLTLTFALMASGPRQQPLQPSKQDGGYTLRQNTKLVVLDVVVTDKKGNLVPNLKKEDFEVQEDKQPQQIASFEAPGAHALPANVVIHSTEELDRLAPNAPATIIVLDEFSEGFADMAFAHYSIQQYLKPQPKLLSQPTMLLAVNIDHFVVLHDYTQDKDAILAALDHHVPDAAWRSGSTGIGANWWREQLISGFRSLAQVAQSTTGHPGHKNIIWVGHGFPHIRESSLSHDDETMVKAILQKEINLLLAARVTLYSINPVGVAFGNEPFKNLVNIADVAKATGGKWFFNRNDVDAEIGTSARDGQEFYTLSYVPTSNSEEKGEFRNIRIVMRDPSLRATTHQGYYPNPLPEPKQLQWYKTAKTDNPLMPLDLKDEVATTLVYDGVPLTLSRGATPGTVTARVDSSAVPWVDHGPDAPRTAKLEMLRVTFDKKDKRLQQAATVFEARAPAIKSGMPVQKVTIDLPLTFDADPRAVRLRVVVRALDSGRIGTANLDIAAK